LPAALLVFLLLGAPGPGKAQALSLTVRIQGLDGAVHQAALSSLTLERLKGENYLTDSLIRRFHDEAPGQITRALEPFGYYSATVEPHLETENGRYDALYIVTKGEPVRVTTLNIRLSGDGSRSSALLEQRKAFPLTKGDILVHSVYEQGKRALISTALQTGYLDARYLTSTVYVRKEDGTATIDLELETGPRFSFGKVTFDQDFLSPEYLEGFVTIREGDPFEQSALLELQRTLYDSDQFRRVEVTADRAEADGLVVPVHVILEPGPSRKFVVGIGYGTDSGPRFRAGWENRRLNRKVHRLRTDLLLTSVQSTLSGLYSVPLKRPRTDHMDYSLVLEQERIDDIRSQTATLGLSHVRLRGGSLITEYLRYLWDNYDVASDEGKRALLIPGLGYSYVRADSRINTRKGFKLDLELKGAQEGFLSKFSFLQADLRFKAIAPLWKGGRVLVRGERATTWITDFGLLPASLRYFAGGDQSVRGFAYKSLSPLDAAGDTIGGRYLVVGSVEYEHSLSRSWSAAVFSDVGNALENMSDPLERGAGVGLRWQSIVGMVRLDMAWALSREDKPWRIHLNIGPDL